MPESAYEGVWLGSVEMGYEPTPVRSFSPKGLSTNLTSHETGGVTLMTLMTQEFPSFPIEDSPQLGQIKAPQGTAGPAQRLTRKYYLDR